MNKLIFAPVNLGLNHWVLLVINPRAEEIYMDSLPGGHQDCEDVKCKSPLKFRYFFSYYTTHEKMLLVDLSTRVLLNLGIFLLAFVAAFRCLFLLVIVD